MKQWHITDKTKNTPATINGVSHENVVSNRKRAIGGPTMKAKPRERLFIPRHLINLSGSNTSEMTTHVSVLKAPEKKIIYKKNKS